MKQKLNELLTFKELGDNRGKLVVIEGLQDVPFEIKRIFYIYGTDKDVIRGNHANKKSEFVIINVCGSSKVKINDGEREEVVVLDKPNTGIYIPRMIWKDMYDFSEDSIMLVLSSEHYDNNEYIRDYDKFLEEINKNAAQN